MKKPSGLESWRCEDGSAVLADKETRGSWAIFTAETQGRGGLRFRAAPRFHGCRFSSWRETFCQQRRLPTALSRQTFCAKAALLRVGKETNSPHSTRILEFRLFPRKEVAQGHSPVSRPPTRLRFAENRFSEVTRAVLGRRWRRGFVGVLFA